MVVVVVVVQLPLVAVGEVLDPPVVGVGEVPRVHSVQPEPELVVAVWLVLLLSQPERACWMVCSTGIRSVLVVIR